MSIEKVESLFNPRGYRFVFDQQTKELFFYLNNPGFFQVKGQLSYLFNIAEGSFTLAHEDSTPLTEAELREIVPGTYLIVIIPGVPLDGTKNGPIVDLFERAISCANNPISCVSGAVSSYNRAVQSWRENNWLDVIIYIFTIVIVVVIFIICYLLRFRK
jgi:hypothetical protein